MAKKTIVSKKQKLTAHGLLGSLSYWGSAARFLLVGILIVFAFLINLSGDSSAQYVDTEIMFLIFGLGTLLLLDLGYVTAARALPLNRQGDRWMVMLSDLGIGAFFILPSLIQLNVDGNKLRAISLLAVLFLLTLRSLVGLLFAKRK